MSSIFPEVRTFVKGLVKNINEGVSLKECFDDDRDAVTMVFGMNDCRNQFQCDFCPCCGEYISCETPGVRKCDDGEHLIVARRRGEKARQRKYLTNIIHWLNVAKLDEEPGDYETGVRMVKYLVEQDGEGLWRNK